jgi:hypothetical protein
MNLKLMIVSLVIVALPGCARAQSAIMPDDAQQVIAMISGDKDKTQTYCDIVKLNDQIDQTDHVGSNTDELNQQKDQLAEKLGSEWSALMTAYRDADLNTKAGLETVAQMQTLYHGLAVNERRHRPDPCSKTFVDR